MVNMIIAVGKDLVKESYSSIYYKQKHESFLREFWTWTRRVNMLWTTKEQQWCKNKKGKQSSSFSNDFTNKNWAADTHFELEFLKGAEAPSDFVAWERKAGVCNDTYRLSVRVKAFGQQAINKRFTYVADAVLLAYLYYCMLHSDCRGGELKHWVIGSFCEHALLMHISRRAYWHDAVLWPRSVTKYSQYLQK